MTDQEVLSKKKARLRVVCDLGIRVTHEACRVEISQTRKPTRVRLDVTDQAGVVVTSRLLDLRIWNLFPELSPEAASHVDLVLEFVETLLFPLVEAAQHERIDEVAIQDHAVRLERGCKIQESFGERLVVVGEVKVTTDQYDLGASASDGWLD